MIAISKLGILLVLAMQLVIQPTAGAGAVGDVLGLVGTLGDNLLQPVVCLENGAVVTLQELLKALSLDALSNILLSALGPVLTNINTLLAQILAALG
ncbi:uncharacterized protein Dvir_GJ26702 [Drosophila virilis]|uniref:Uncharacterized protein n=1 Tax=Drosophila virilis TaxID=7244 RepID=A0A0Q9WIP4_DROVI|nr:uncharacterized protein Dvir_GJ26702 [Drosophila virilis]